VKALATRFTLMLESAIQSCDGIGARSFVLMCAPGGANSGRTRCPELSTLVDNSVSK